MGMGERGWEGNEKVGMGESEVGDYVGGKWIGGERVERKGVFLTKIDNPLRKRGGALPRM